MDRLIDIAASLDEIDAPPLRLIVYGEARHAGGRYFEEMKTRIEDERLGHRLVFKGFVSNPEEVLQSAFALVRPSRENDPWGETLSKQRHSAFQFWQRALLAVSWSMA